MKKVYSTPEVQLISVNLDVMTTSIVLPEDLLEAANSENLE